MAALRAEVERLEAEEAADLATQANSAKAREVANEAERQGLTRALREAAHRSSDATAEGLRARAESEERHDHALCEPLEHALVTSAGRLALEQAEAERQFLGKLHEQAETEELLNRVRCLRSDIERVEAKRETAESLLQSGELRTCWGKLCVMLLNQARLQRFVEELDLFEADALEAEAAAREAVRAAAREAADAAVGHAAGIARALEEAADASSLVEVAGSASSNSGSVEQAPAWAANIAATAAASTAVDGTAPSGRSPEDMLRRLGIDLAGALAEFAALGLLEDDVPDTTS